VEAAGVEPASGSRLQWGLRDLFRDLYRGGLRPRTGSHRRYRFYVFARLPNREKGASQFNHAPSDEHWQAPRRDGYVAV